jgi:hypothetical protein
VAEWQFHAASIRRHVGARLTDKEATALAAPLGRLGPAAPCRAPVALGG